MSDPTAPFTPFIPENPTATKLPEEIAKEGITSQRNFSRVIFRLNWLESVLKERKDILAAGNLAELAPEIHLTNHFMQDMIDTMREAVTLIGIGITLFRQEQGFASPPKPLIDGGENPPDAPVSVDASAQNGAEGQGNAN